MKFYPRLVATALSATSLVACSSGDLGGPDVDVIDASASERSLQPFDNSDAFFGALGQALVAQSSDQGFVLEGGDSGDDGLASEPVPASGAIESVDSSSDSIASSGEAGNEVTSTNVQEQGVDEQDWVKVSSDGSTLYIVESVQADVFIQEGGPIPVDGAIDSIAVEPAVLVGADASLTIAPAPFDVQTTLRVMSLDAQTPDASEVQELDIQLDGRSAQGAYVYERENSTSVFVTASGNNFWAYWDDSTAFANQTSIITEVDVTNAGSAAVTGSLTIDGQLVSSRRIGKHLIFASRYYPTLPGEPLWNLTPEQVQVRIDNTDPALLLPQYTAGGADESMPLIDPAECFVAPQSGDNTYYSPDIITLGVIDLDTLQLTDSKCYLGASETLYASPDAIFLATTQYSYSGQPTTETGDVIDTNDSELIGVTGWWDPRVDTDIHQFDIEEGQLSYAGSGAVKGHLGWNALRKPFRMSEKDGYLRVATFNDQQGANDSPILMTVLQADGTGKLNTVSTLPNENEPAPIGKPGEQLYASRFLGDRAYLVTFLQTDPLYVVDLSNPQAPRVVGELEIEGFSDYLHPVGEDYLLGIGKDAVAAPSGGFGDGRGGLVQGVKLSLFNVSNPAEPTEVQSLVVGQRGTQSQALNDHRAITVQPATEDHPLRISFGIDVNGQTSPDVPTPASTAFTYYPWSYSGLHGFDINVGADAGIVPRGALVVETASDSNGYFGYGMQDRSVMVNDSLFYIRGSSVHAARWDDLGNPSPAR